MCVCDVPCCRCCCYRITQTGTLLRYIWQRVLDEKADTTEETQAVAASDYVGEEGEDDDDCRCHGNTKR